MREKITPETFAHMRQFLSYVPRDKWGQIQKVADMSLSGKLTHKNKIKPSSWKSLKSSAFENIKPLTDEFLGHHDPKSNEHMGGGIHEAIQTALQVVAGWIGGRKLNEWFAGEKEIKAIPEYQKELVRLLQATYQKDRAETVGGWSRIDDLDSEYGSGRIFFLIFRLQQALYRKQMII